MVSIKSKLPQEWVLFLSFLTLLIPLFLMEYPLLQYSNGDFIYPHDETYIRMATAKNITFHGAWGLSGSEFNSTSSSILYPLILAIAYKLFGLYSGIPFLINLIVALLLIWVMQQWLLKQGLTPWQQFCILILVIALTPLPVLVITGLEHTLQIFLTFLFLIQINKLLADQDRRYISIKHLPWKICLLGFLMTTCRYEGLFLIVIACFMLLFRCRILALVELLLISVFPLLLFGLYSIKNGEFIVPTSILIKAIPLPLNGEAIWKFLTIDIVNRVIYPYTPGASATNRIIVILPFIYCLLVSQLRQNIIYRNIFLFCLIGTILHLTFSASAFFYRYEAYLIAIFILIAGTLVARYSRGVWPIKCSGERWMALWVVMFLIIPFLWRSWLAYKDIRTEYLNMYEMNYQEAIFLNRYYNGAVIITDDIGTTSYLSQGPKLDLYGCIRYTEVARAKEQSYYQMKYLQYLILKERPVIAIIADNRYPAELKKSWIKVADLFTENWVVFYNSQLSFYAMDKIAVQELKRNIQNFERSLPLGVKVVYQ